MCEAAELRGPVSARRFFAQLGFFRQDGGQVRLSGSAVLVQSSRACSDVLRKFILLLGISEGFIQRPLTFDRAISNKSP